MLLMLLFMVVLRLAYMWLLALLTYVVVVNVYVAVLAHGVVVGV